MLKFKLSIYPKILCSGNLTQKPKHALDGVKKVARILYVPVIISLIGEPPQICILLIVLQTRASLFGLETATGIIQLYEPEPLFDILVICPKKLLSLLYKEKKTPCT